MSRRSESEKVPKTDLLKIDKDCLVDGDWIRDYVRTAVSVCKRFGLRIISIKKCPSKSKGLHFYISLSHGVAAAFANRLQWLLGDDAKRVNFNRARIDCGVVEWNKLFEVVGRRLRTIYRNPN